MKSQSIYISPALINLNYGNLRLTENFQTNLARARTISHVTP